MHVNDRFHSLVHRFSIYLLAFACTKRECCLCIQILKPKVVPDESTISTYMRYYSAVPSKFACATSNHSNKHLFCVPVPLMKWQGVVSIFHVKRVILMMGVYSLVIARERAVIGMPNPAKQKYIIKQTPPES